ncbi:MAG: spermidine synthase [Planctomycetota bacterium]
MLSALVAGCAAALLFSVELLYARLLLPRTGGSAAVWTTCLLFFQVVLLAGYALGHALARRRVRTQVGLYLLLVAAGALALPLRIDPGFMPRPERPLLDLLLALGRGLLLPFLALSTATPVLLAWRAREGARPERLLAASNAGSLLGLLAYPLLVEPWIGLFRQTVLWTAGYGLWALLLVVTGLRAARAPGAGEAPPAASSSAAPRRARRGSFAGAEAELRSATPLASSSPPPGATRPRAGCTFAGAEAELRSATPLASSSPPPGATRPRAGCTFRAWALLALLPAALLYGVTTALTDLLPPTPLLWVLPLALYLLSFVLAFAPARPPDPARLRALAGLVVPLLLTAWLLRGAVARSPGALFGLLVAQLLGFGLVALALHTELARRAPPGGESTRFNLAIGAGGALGGLLCAVAAPLLLSLPLEYPLLLALAVPVLAPGAGQGRAHLFGLSVLAPALLLALRPGRLGLALPALLLTGALALALARQLRWSRRRALLALALLTATGLGHLGPPDLWAARSLHGVHRVVERDGVRHYLMNGVVHGREDPARPREPMAYFAREAPLGVALEAWSAAAPRGSSALVIGLGVGGMLPYARPGQRWRFYELDPLVERVARERFDYLRDARAGVEVAIGDGRLLLEAEARRRAPPHELLVLDAFNGDAVPVHLLTEEAFALYTARLAPRGLLVCNVTCRWLRLEPLIARHAARLGLSGVARAERVDAAARRRGRADSRCVVLARSPAALEPLRARGFTDLGPPAARTWTDDRASVLELLAHATLPGE